MGFARWTGRKRGECGAPERGRRLDDRERSPSKQSAKAGLAGVCQRQRHARIRRRASSVLEHEGAWASASLASERRPGDGGDRDYEPGDSWSGRCGQLGRPP